MNNDEHNSSKAKRESLSTSDPKCKAGHESEFVPRVLNGVAIGTCLLGVLQIILGIVCAYYTAAYEPDQWKGLNTENLAFAGVVFGIATFGVGVTVGCAAEEVGK